MNSTLTSSQISFINICESAPLDSRYHNLSCVNAGNGVKDKGCFSFIFKARDTLEDVDVAIKFFDPEQMGVSELAIYRMQSFKREVDMLVKVTGKRRCLQLVEGVKQHIVPISIPATPPIIHNIQSEYFVTEWIEDDIEKYGLSHTSFNNIDKLTLFRSTILSVNMMHNNNISHRDLKLDNLKIRGKDLHTEDVVAIDYGTATHDSSLNLLSEYNHQAGHRWYASPESLCGLAKNKRIGYATDFYALGCIFYEMFNDGFYFSLINNSPTLKGILTALTHGMTMIDEANRPDEWSKLLVKFKPAINMPSIVQLNNDIDKSIEKIVERLHFSLIAFDFNDREIDFNKVLRKIDTCITILNNKTYQSALKKRKLKILENKENKQAARLVKRLSQC
jgi:serine/threonine protein kinase